MACRLRSEKEAKHYLKITLAWRKTRRGSETKFPWWYFLHTGGFWLANEEQLPFSQRHFSLSLFHFPLTSDPSFSHYHSLLSPLRHLLNFLIQHTQSTQVWGAIRSRGRAVLRVTRRSGVHAVRARLQTVPLCLSWDNGYVSWWAGEQKVLHYTKTAHLSSKFTFTIIVRKSRSH